LVIFYYLLRMDKQKDEISSENKNNSEFSCWVWDRLEFGLIT